MRVQIKEIWISSVSIQKQKQTSMSKGASKTHETFLSKAEKTYAAKLDHLVSQQIDLQNSTVQQPLLLGSGAGGEREAVEGNGR